MKNILTALKRAPRRAAGLAVVLAAVVIPAGLLAWGPDRATFTLEQPADYVTFNSITNNKKHGDERNFVQIREYSEGSQFGEQVNLQAGKEYEVYVFYHNNAKTSLNESGEGIARNAQMRVQMPASVAKGEKARITGVVSADNAKHLDTNGVDRGNQVWDEAYGVSNDDLTLRYVQESATLTNADASGNNRTFDLPNELLTTGTKLGWDKMDGNLPGCNEYSGYVKFRFKAVKPDFEILKQVSKHGEAKYQKEMTSTPGATVDYRIQYKNTGSVRQDNVVIKDTLPAGVTYIPGSTHVATSATNGQWQQISENDVVTNKGINIGSYAPGGNAFVRFSAKVASAEELECGSNKLTNKARVETDNGDKEDEAHIIVKKECEEPEKIKVCELESKKIIVIDEKDFDSSKHSKNLEDCKDKPAPEPEKIKVCEITTGNILTINKQDFDANKHSMNLADCEKTPETPEVPEQPAPETPTCPIPGKEHLPKDSADCATPAPVELPQTGSSTGVLSILGLGLITIAAGYALTGCRLLN